METNDKLLKDFFSENKKEIADNGFTKRVMRKLPEQTDKSWIVWIFTALGMAISLYMGITSGFIEHVMMLTKHVSIYYILGGIFCFPLLGTAGYFMNQMKNIRLF
jgi:hypothetical protein